MLFRLFLHFNIQIMAAPSMSLQLWIRPLFWGKSKASSGANVINGNLKMENVDQADEKYHGSKTMEWATGLSV